MKIEQIRSTDGTGTLSYIIFDETTPACIVIDPNVADLEILSGAIRSRNASLKYIVDTHTHADHISGAAQLRDAFNARVVMHENTKNKWKIVDEGDRFGIGDILRANAKIPIDLYVNDNEEIAAGSLVVRVMFTPGHTDNHVSLRVGDNLFTGDLLLIGQAGRSDLPGGNTEEQYISLMKKILPLPDETKMYPGHDYAGNTFSLLGEEKRNNPFLQKRTLEEYIAFVAEFFPPLAEATSGGANMTLQCGVQRVAQPADTFRSISPRQLHEMLTRGEKLLLLDVREPAELVSLGAIEGVQNISVRQLRQRAAELPRDKSTPVVSICASGSRSTEAAHFLQQLGYTTVMNLAGGTIGWIREGLPVARPYNTSPVS